MSQVLPIGTVLKGRYKVLELVGQGGMGAVYRAEDLRLKGRECAVKEVLPELTANPSSTDQTQEQFYREASTLARLDHPNLPKVSDYFSDQDREYLVMDFVPGRDLKQIMDEARRQGYTLRESQVLAWARQLCDALQYLHTQEPPVLHRDIKPANIKLTPNGTIKLVDFGLVKLMAVDENRTVTVVQGRGTLQYTPLEQYGGDTGHTDRRSDIYALGATLYHLLTGIPPADAKQRFLRPGSLQLPRTLNPTVSQRTEKALMVALAMHPDARPASAAEFADRLFGTPAHGQRVSGDQILVQPQTPVSWSEAVAQNRWLALSAAALLLIAVALTFFPPVS